MILFSIAFYATVHACMSETTVKSIFPRKIAHKWFCVRQMVFDIASFYRFYSLVHSHLLNPFAVFFSLMFFFQFWAWMWKQCFDFYSSVSCVWNVLPLSLSISNASMLLWRWSTTRYSFTYTYICVCVRESVCMTWCIRAWANIDVYWCIHYYSDADVDVDTNAIGTFAFALSLFIAVSRYHFCF